MNIRRLLLLIAIPLLTGCTRFDILNGLIPSDFHRTSNYSYGNLPRQHLDVYQPENLKKPAGIVIFFYGGYWSAGDRDGYLFAGEALTSQGFIAVLPDYRIYPNVTFPKFVEDGASAVRWVHDNAARIGGDPKHIYLMGHSAGAHIAALLTLDGRYLKAVGLDRSNIAATCGLAGPYDFKIGPKSAPIFNMASYTQAVDPAVEPINWVDGHEPPMMLVQGSLDTTVDPGNATRLADRIKQKGGVVQLNIYPTQSHEGVVLALAAPFRWIAPVLHDATEFFRKY